MMDKELKDDSDVTSKDDSDVTTPESVLPLEHRTMIVAALNKIDPRYRPRPLPVGQVCGYILSKPGKEWIPRIMLLDSVCQMEKGPIGTTWQDKVDALMDMVNNAEIEAFESAPTKTAKELQDDIAGTLPAGTSQGDDASGDGGSEPEPGADAGQAGGEGLDSFTTGAPASQLEPPAPPTPPAPTPDPKPEPDAKPKTSDKPAPEKKADAKKTEQTKK